MIRFLADENFNGYVTSALRRRLSQLDFVTAAEAGLKGLSDPDLLAWAARDERVLLTHDVTTLIHFANERLRLGLSLSGVIVVNRRLRVSNVIEDLMLVAECSDGSEWQGKIRFLPLV